jgi:plasmid stabilization system protein ParE
MKIVVHESAARDLDGIFGWISKDGRGAAAELVRRIQLRINRLLLPALRIWGGRVWSKERANGWKRPIL